MLSSHFSARLLGFLVTLGLMAPGASAAAQRAHSDSLGIIASIPPRPAPHCAGWDSLQGRRIESVVVVTDGVTAAGAFRILRAAHTATQPYVVRDVFGVQAGTVLDTAAIRDGLRRVRALNLFTDVQLTVAECASDGVRLTLRTIDQWTESVQLRYAAGPGLSMTVTERSIAGSGLAATMGVLADDGRLAPSGTLRDPLLFHGRATATVSGTKYSDGALRSATFAPTPSVLASDWLLWTRLSSSHRAIARDTVLTLTPKDSAALAADTVGSSLDSTYTPVREGYRLARSTASALAGRYIGTVAGSRVYLLLGLERVRADLHVAPERLTLGAQDVQRDFTGGTYGIGLRATEYTDIGWYVSPDRPLQLPQGLEFDIVQTRGYDRAGGASMIHLDGWAGFTFAPTPLGLLTLDLWMNEYRSEGIVSNAVTRAAAQWIRPTRAGYWLLRAGSETIHNPDPDVHALTTLDAIRQVVSPRSNLAESARTVLLEHDWRLPLAVSHRSVALAAFGAMSRRRGTLSPNANDPLLLQAVVAGVGARLWPASPGEGPIALNFGYPVERSPIGNRGWFFTLQVTTAPGAGRGRQ